MSWKREVEEIEERRELARKMGGDEAIEKQHSRGRLNVRERIDHMAAPGSFHEHGPLAGHPERDEEGNLVHHPRKAAVVARNCLSYLLS